MMIRTLLGILAFSSSFALADEIWLSESATQIDMNEVDSLLAQSHVLVLGENHYDPEIIQVEADLIERLSAHGTTTLGWEFLNRIDLDKVTAIAGALKSGDTSAEVGLEAFFPNSSAIAYKPLFELVARSDINLIPTNLTRAQKTPVTKNGIAAAEPGIVPPDFAMGTANYFERFQEAMGSHPLPSPVENYFASQCLTDDVMAYSLAENPAERKVLVTGAFHGDYRDGAVERLKARLKDDTILYVKIVQKSDLAKEDFALFLNDPIYGPIADVLYLVDRESSAKPTR